MKKLFMEKGIIFFVLLVSTILLSKNYTFFFKDCVINYIEFSGNEFEIPSDQEIFWISNVQNWQIKNKNNDYSFSFKIINLDDYKDYYMEKIEDNIFSLKSTQIIIFYNNQLNRWCETNKSNLKYLSKKESIVFDKDIKGWIGLKSKGTWDFIYEMYNDGTFNKNIELNGSILGESNVYLINQKLNTSINSSERLMRSLNSVPKIYQDVFTLNIGMLNTKNKINYINLKSYDILSFSDDYIINLNNVQTSAEIIRTIENTDYNGMGIDIVNGKILIHEIFDDKSFAIKKVLINNFSNGENIKIDLGKSWNIKYKLNKTKDTFISSSRTRFIEYTLIINNYSNEEKKISIEMKQPGLELINYDNNYFKNNSSIGSIELKGKMKMNSQQKIKLSIKIQN
ncbi:hypothetical protein OSSY52_21130 [Tepiditoga spiralis]|uniref:DUF4139 domain-containing protein n=1 Tax=Tepiditoga spiralis TaxID=2108365 RepID=A0A7G1GBT7_9BACT|nr:hypothetical protein [Tepiditoga spiralis]BBE31972.1 hypothetical protein OSSY52_21130 [Tepiditoga spiralis]